VVGDAAGLANPLNGEGHGPALLAGVNAGQVLSRALQNEQVTEASLWEFNRYIWQEFGTLHAWGIALIQLMNRYDADLYDLIINNELLTQEDIMSIINSPEQKISTIDILKRGWKYPTLLYHLFIAQRHVKKIHHLIEHYPESPSQDFTSWSDKMAKLEQYT